MSLSVPASPPTVAHRFETLSLPLILRALHTFYVAELSRNPAEGDVEWTKHHDRTRRMIAHLCSHIRTAWGSSVISSSISSIRCATSHASLRVVFTARSERDQETSYEQMSPFLAPISFPVPALDGFGEVDPDPGPDLGPTSAAAYTPTCLGACAGVGREEPEGAVEESRIYSEAWRTVLSQCVGGATDETVSQRQ